MILRNSSPQTIVVLVIPMLFLNAVTEINFKPKFKSYYRHLEDVMKVWIYEIRINIKFFTNLIMYFSYFLIQYLEVI